jgi:dolichol-phosphate mannosyltransferase
MNLTIIVPTRNEAANVGPLVDELSVYIPSGTRLIFVDDSSDEMTVQALHLAQAAAPSWLEIHVVHRSESERNGLAGAVIHGFELAGPGTWALVMDGDLQHPPAIIPSMVDAMHRADVVVASRYCFGGNASGLNGLVRCIVSRACTYLAKSLFPAELRNVSDPMSGCFAVRLDKVRTDRLQPAGFKILLELLASHPYLRRTEVPIRMAARGKGVSKSNLRVGWQFLRQLYRLRAAPMPALDKSK